MMPYEKLLAWKVAHDLALEMYRVTEGWPRSERYGLTSQARRAALSIPTNIAEGVAKAGPESSDAFWTCASVLRRSCHIYCYSAETAGCSHLLNGSSWIPSGTVSGSSSGACTDRFSAGLVHLID